MAKRSDHKGEALPVPIAADEERDRRLLVRA